MIEQYRSMLADAETDLFRMQDRVRELEILVRYCQRKLGELQPYTAECPELAEASGEGETVVEPVFAYDIHSS